MSVSNIPESVKFRLWGKAAGRCQYDGCNKPLWLDNLTKAEFNTAYIAHIIADKKNGPRGDKLLSPKLKSDISNLMLMCDEHHRLIDKIDVAGHTVTRLTEMKKKHEERIEIHTAIQNDKRSHVLLYGANIGEQNAHLSYEKAAVAMSPNYFPARNHAIELGLKNSALKDHDAVFWQSEVTNLEALFAVNVRPQLALSEIQHLSIFGFAPIPLLVKLGGLLSDIPSAEVYQLHREPADWVWQIDYTNKYILERPDEIKGVPAVILSLSATVVDSRISSVLTDEHSIWKLTLSDPGNDYLKNREQLSEFRRIFRKMLDVIKAMHGQGTPIHIFPAIPVSVAVEIGRVWMPKADSPLVIYDQNNKTGGFSPALTMSI